MKTLAVIAWALAYARLMHDLRYRDLQVLVKRQLAYERSRDAAMDRWARQANREIRKAMRTRVY